MAGYAFRVLRSQATLRLLSSDGSRAHYLIKNKIRVLRLLKRRWSTFSATGSVEVHSIRPGKIVKQKRILGGYRSLIAYDPPLRPGQTLEATAALHFKDSFTNPDEWFGIHVAYPTDSLSIRVLFPRRTKVLSSIANSFFSMEPFPEERPTVETKNNTVQILWEKSKPRTGAEYRIYWTWKPKRSRLAPKKQ